MSASSPAPSPIIGHRKDSVNAQDEQHDYKIERTNGMQRKSVLNASTCVSSGESTTRSRKIRRRDESLASYIRKGIVDHQLGLSINCLLLLALTHTLFPSLRPITSSFFLLSHRDARTGLYEPGLEDMKYVTLWIVIFTGLRAGTMDYILVPWAKRLGVTKKKSTVRFAEQAWLLIYVSVFWSVGMYLYYNSSYFANLPAMWANFPTKSMSPLMKWYYLAQFAFWLQQIVVVNIEERRNDHWQMFTHHIITSALIFGSYGYYQTKVGNVILCIMDVVDLILPAAKMLRYAGYQTACDIAFGIFIVTWFAARHVIYLAVCWSLYTHVPEVMPSGCYDITTGKRLTSDGGNAILSNVLHAFYGQRSAPVCMNDSIRLSFLGLLLALQVITIIWFTMIVRVAYNVLSGKGADDSRSDDEGDGEEEYEYEEAEGESVANGYDTSAKAAYKAPIEEEASVEDLRFVKRNASPKQRRSKARASGISIPGHGDHKELLGRIGCDKPGS